MIPKTELRYSWKYCKNLNSEISKREFLKLKRDNQKFEKLYNKHIKQILKLIEKYHGKQWIYRFIPIYIVLKAPSSRSDPLTLNYKKNEKFQLIILIHELLHNNMKNMYKKFKNSEESHKYMESIVNKITRDLPINLKKELNLFNKKTKEPHF